MEIEKEVKKMTLGHEFGAGAACLKCKDKCEGFELHFWRKICRNCKCGVMEHDVERNSEENHKVGKLFEDTKYTSLMAKLKRDGIPSYQANMVTITMPGSGTAHIVPPLASSTVVPPAAATGFSVQPPGSSVGAAPPGATAQPTAPVITSVKANAQPVAVNATSANVVPVAKDVPVKTVTYEWVPPVANKYLAVQYIQLLPPEKRPVAGTEGAAYRWQQMARQLPEHDQDPDKCHELTPAEVKKMQQFVRKYKDEALGVGDIRLPGEMAQILAAKQGRTGGGDWTRGPGVGGGAGGPGVGGGAGGPGVGGGAWGPGVGGGAGGPGVGGGAWGPGVGGGARGPGVGAGAGGPGIGGPGVGGGAGGPGVGAGGSGVGAGGPGVGGGVWGPGVGGGAGGPGVGGGAGGPGVGAGGPGVGAGGPGAGGQWVGAGGPGVGAGGPGAGGQWVGAGGPGVGAGGPGVGAGGPGAGGQWVGAGGPGVGAGGPGVGAGGPGAGGQWVGAGGPGVGAGGPGAGGQWVGAGGPGVGAGGPGVGAGGPGAGAGGQWVGAGGPGLGAGDASGPCGVGSGVGSMGVAGHPAGLLPGYQPTAGFGPAAAGAMGTPATVGAMGVPGAQQAGTQQTFSCNHCQEPMGLGNPAVYAERAGYDKMWHPACFVCCTCKELLVDMIYFWKKGKLYCGRHYGDSEKPRCAGCDELIFCNEYTQAEGHNWHLKHFCCFDCDCVLAGETYVMENDKPVCKPCYMKNYAVKCSSCQTVVDPEAQRVSYGEHHWHAEPQCFKCAGCSKCLMGQRFMVVQAFLFCSVECKKIKMS